MKCFSLRRTVVLRLLGAAIVACAAAGCAAPRGSHAQPNEAAVARPEPVTFASADGGMVEADTYGRGDRAVVLVHGGRYDKRSWNNQAEKLAASGFLVLAINLRGYGDSRAGEAGESAYGADVLGAVRYLKGIGARSVSLVGASIGGLAAAQAAVDAAPGEIDRVVLIAPSAIAEPERMQGRKLYILARDDPNAEGKPRLIRIQAQFDRAPQPKELVLLEGSAHAQQIFGTDQGPQLMSEIERFLTAP
jgi:pimeloyl-ACP methyl ester carboxylesterase